jgi:hypothetical protein
LKNHNLNKSITAIVPKTHIDNKKSINDLHIRDNLNSLSKCELIKNAEIDTNTIDDKLLDDELVDELEGVKKEEEEKKENFSKFLNIRPKEKHETDSLEKNQYKRAVKEVLENCAMNSQSSTGLIGDYAEMVSQFTYIVLWSAVFPLAPFFALIVNYTQLKGEMSLECENKRRKYPHKANNIGAWLPILETVSMISVVSNTVLILHTFNSRVDFETQFNNTEIFKSDISYLWVVAAIEHAVIILKLTLSYCMDDCPSWVKQLREVEDARDRRYVFEDE